MAFDLDIAYDTDRFYGLDGIPIDGRRWRRLRQSLGADALLAEQTVCGVTLCAHYLGFDAAGDDHEPGYLRLAAYEATGLLLAEYFYCSREAQEAHLRSLSADIAACGGDLDQVSW